MAITRMPAAAAERSPSPRSATRSTTTPPHGPAPSSTASTSSPPSPSSGSPERGPASALVGDGARLQALDQPAAPGEVVAFVADAQQQGGVGAEVRRLHRRGRAAVAALSPSPDRLVLGQPLGVLVGLLAEQRHRLDRIGQPQRVRL